MGRNYFLHRISHGYECSYPILEKGYLSTGYEELFNKKLYKIVENGDYHGEFKSYVENIWGECPKWIHHLWRFIYSFRKGDYIVVPQFGGLFSIYEIIGDNFIGRNDEELKSALKPFIDTKDYTKLDFFWKVKPIYTNIKRAEYANAELTRKMHYRGTNIACNDIAETINELLENLNNNKPINFTYDILNTWQFPFNKSKEIIKDIFSIIQKYANNDMLEKYRDYIKKNTLNENYPFNIFELISDTYYKENFHSDIIAKLLEHEKVLKYFLDFIDVDASKYLNNDYSVVREENKIDILIKTDTNNCIIIENKLRWAKDMNEQLSRYYNNCLENNLEVDKIVYLSPDRLKQPTSQSIKDIPKEKIKTIYGYDGEDEDFYTKVIENSLNDFKKHDEAKEWILLADHYLKILRETGVTKMDKLTQDFYKEIINNTDEYEKIKLIADMYNNLIVTRINNLVSKFKGAEWNKEWFYKEFESKKRGLNYAIDIHIYYDNSYFYFLSRSEYTEDDPKLIKEWEKDNKDIEAWLKKHNLFDAFYFDDRWVKEFKFPQQEKELYDFTEKFIQLLEKDVESICSK
ncbi:PD-(D/E)XK nuclease family protein [Brachyspira sp.]|uniref:PD-(D/E)XK nuclease family protein n=1 Tax=Brachyspira sp. TaxID=1977261 RepID=UPI0026277940|nr:PD-(D/E)XK nuclease family protein [Brachyspira sp.]